MRYQELYDKYYPENSRVRDILQRHSESVAELAVSINDALELGLDDKQVYEAAMLHDIGIFLTDAPVLTAMALNHICGMAFSEPICSEKRDFLNGWHVWPNAIQVPE